MSAALRRAEGGADVAETLQTASDLDRALEHFLALGHNRALGLELAGHGAGWIEFRMPWRREITADGEGIAPGAIYSLLDSVCALTTWARQGFFTNNPTLDLRVDFLRPPTPGRGLVARGECWRIGGDLANMRGIAHEGNPDDPVAQCTGAFIVVEKRS